MTVNNKLPVEIEKKPLTLLSIRKANLDRQNDAIVRGLKFGGKDWDAAQWFQAMVGEVGEYANFRKKYERGDLTHQEFLLEAKKELADVLTYLDLLAAHLGIDLEEAVVTKFNEVSDRINSDVRL